MMAPNNAINASPRYGPCSEGLKCDDDVENNTDAYDNDDHYDEDGSLSPLCVLGSCMRQLSATKV